MRAICAAGPPKESKPIFSQVALACLGFGELSFKVGKLQECLEYQAEICDVLIQAGGSSYSHDGQS